MDKNHNKNLLFQRIKQINKNSNLNYTEYLVKYFPKNTQKEFNKSIFYIEREINVPKRLSKEIMSEEEKIKLCKSMKEQFEKEMKIMSKLSHKGIVKIIDYFEYPENVFHIISENYQYDLDDIIKMQIKKNQSLSEKLIISFFTQICLGIKYIHDLNILHRNINPSNILLISNKIVKISNFDVSRVLYNANEKSITLIKNSWNEYISPEMGMNIPYSFKNDIWSLGILLFHMMAKKVPFNNKQLNDIQNIKKVDPLFIITKIPRHYSNDIKNLCVDLLKAYPADRPDINSILTKYRIIKDEIPIIDKILGGNIYHMNKFDSMDNLYKTDFKLKFDEKYKIKNKNKKEYKNTFLSICTNYIKIGNNGNKTNSKKKSIENNEKKENDKFKLSVYENIKDKVIDPHNIMGREQYISGQVIKIPESQELGNNNGSDKNNSNKFSISREKKEKIKEY